MAFRTMRQDAYFDYYIYTESKRDEGTTYFNGHHHRVTIPAGHYTSPQQLIDIIHDGLNDEGKERIKLRWSAITNRLSFRVDDGAEVKWWDKILCQLFGMPRSGTWDNMGPGDFKGSRVVDMKRGFHSLFIYTDIISPVLVGDASVRLLKIQPIEGDYGQMVSHAYTKMHYVPVQKNYFDIIEINISRDTGNPVHFDFGKVMVKLHFRPRRLAYM